MSVKEIKKGFNQGYTLRKHRPELADKLSKGFQDKDNPYQLAFTQGCKQADKERTKSKARNYTLSKNFVPSKIKTKDKEMDRDR